MPYLGVQPTPYGSPESLEDTFTVVNATQDVFTLNQDVTSESDIIISINGVVQTGLAYALSGVGKRTLTFTPGLVQEDILRVLHLGFKAVSINHGPPDDDSVSEQKIMANAITSIKIQNDAITASKILDGAITLSKIDSSVKLSGPSLGADSIIRTNKKEINEDITFAGDENGFTIGPINLQNSVITVTDGSTWTIV